MNLPVQEIPDEAAAWLIGTFEKPLDDKNRLVVPSGFRKFLGRQELILTVWFHGALALFPKTVWRRMAEVVEMMSLDSEENRVVRTAFFSTATPQSMDNQGRIVLSEEMKDAAGIETKAVILGEWDKILLWSPYRHRDFRRRTEIAPGGRYEKSLARVAGAHISPGALIIAPEEEETNRAQLADRESRTTADDDGK